MNRQSTGLLAGVRRAGKTVANVVLPWLGHALMRVTGVVVTAILALILLFEEWGWQPLQRAFAALSQLRPIAALEGVIMRLPPYGALAMFAAPAALLLPVKLLALYLLAHGQHVLAVAMLIGAKLVGTGIVARIFHLTYPQLMRIGWFARLYGWFMPWKEALYAWVRASWAWRWGRVVKHAAKRWIGRVWRGRRLG